MRVAVLRRQELRVPELDRPAHGGLEWSADTAATLADKTAQDGLAAAKSKLAAAQKAYAQLGVSLDQLRNEFTGSWMFGYATALRAICDLIASTGTIAGRA